MLCSLHSFYLCSVARLMSAYTVEKMPKPFVCITKMERWKEVLYLIMLETWLLNTMYQTTKILAHHLQNIQIQKFYNYVLLPWVRYDIRKNKRLYFALCIPSAFNKGILFHLCKIHITMLWTLSYQNVALFLHVHWILIYSVGYIQSPRRCDFREHSWKKNSLWITQGMFTKICINITYGNV